METTSQEENSIDDTQILLKPTKKNRPLRKRKTDFSNIENNDLIDLDELKKQHNDDIHDLEFSPEIIKLLQQSRKEKFRISHVSDDSDPNFDKLKDESESRILATNFTSKLDSYSYGDQRMLDYIEEQMKIKNSKSEELEKNEGFLVSENSNKNQNLQEQCNYSKLEVAGKVNDDRILSENHDYNSTKDSKKNNNNNNKKNNLDDNNVIVDLSKRNLRRDVAAGDGDIFGLEKRKMTTYENSSSHRNFNSTGILEVSISDTDNYQKIIETQEAVKKHIQEEREDYAQRMNKMRKQGETGFEEYDDETSLTETYSNFLKCMLM